MTDDRLLSVYFHKNKEEVDVSVSLTEGKKISFAILTLHQEHLLGVNGLSVVPNNPTVYNTCKPMQTSKKTKTKKNPHNFEFI